MLWPQNMSLAADSHMCCLSVLVKVWQQVVVISHVGVMLDYVAVRGDHAVLWVKSGSLPPMLIHSLYISNCNAM